MVEPFLDQGAQMAEFWLGGLRWTEALNEDIGADETGELQQALSRRDHKPMIHEARRRSDEAVLPGKSGLGPCVRLRGAYDSPAEAAAVPLILV